MGAEPSSGAGGAADTHPGSDAGVPSVGSKSGLASALGFTGPRGARRDYEVLELLPGPGGQGYVFRARLRSNRLGEGMLGREVALKQLIAGAVGNEDLPDVQQRIGLRTHPNLARQLEAFTGPAISSGDADLDVDGLDLAGSDDDDLTYVAALWVPGETIDAVAPRASVAQVCRWVRHVGAAVDFLHSSSHAGGAMVHRDIKPRNVVVDTDGNAVLIDPGLARPVVEGGSPGGTSRGPRVPHGSSGYIPPECQRDPAASSPAGDRWQVGALAYRLIVGEPPASQPVETLRANLIKALRATHRPEAIAEWIVVMLAVDPVLRPPLAAEWAVRLELAEAAARRPARTWRRVRSVGILAAVALAGAGGYLLHPVTSSSVNVALIGNHDGLKYLPVASRIHSGATAASHPVTVYNKVTNGALTMREDVPAYLSTKAQNFCALEGCEIPGTDMGTGTQLTATCQTEAETTTNGDNNNDVDLHNPGRFTSNLWYGITLPDKAFGYLSVVWLAPGDRSGFGLPPC
jgi:Protein kinase domain